MSRLTIDISEQQHKSLKALAALNGKSIREYAIERLFPADDDESWQALKTLVGQRIKEGLAGAVSEKSFDAIVAEELQKDRPA